MAKNFKELQAKMSAERQQKNADAVTEPKIDWTVVLQLCLIGLSFAVGYATHARTTSAVIRNLPKPDVQISGSVPASSR